MVILSANTTAAAPSAGGLIFGMLPSLFVIGLVAILIVSVKKSNSRKALLKNKRQQEAKGSIADRLEALDDLLKKGIITQEEFDAKKKQLLEL